ncbi:MAG: stalk domain-containing protein [Lachnospirales bacterium]
MKKLLKKLTIGMLSVATVIGTVTLQSQATYASEKIKVMVDGEYIKFDEPPINDNGSVFVPMRALYEALGFEVKWDSMLSVVAGHHIKDNYSISTTLWKDGDIMSLNYLEYEKGETIINNHVTNRFNDEKNAVEFYKRIPVDPSAKNLNGRILLPVRAISEGTGAKVKWDGTTQTVSIDSSNLVIKDTETGISYEVNKAKERVDKHLAELEKTKAEEEKAKAEEERKEAEEKVKLEEERARREEEQAKLEKEINITLEEYQEEVLRLVNIERNKAGVAPLQSSKDLMRIAQLKAEEMEELGYFSHESPVYGSPSEFATHYGYSNGIGENIVNNFLSPEETMTRFMNSDGHRENILNSGYRYLGIGRSGENDASKLSGYGVQMFD